LVKVDLGNGETTSIVCGAKNFEIGNKVPVALVGAVVPQNKIKIEKREVRGEISCGMLCAQDELGLGKDHAGILILGNDLRPGTSLIEALQLDDVVLDFDVLPNRAHDCLSHIGMAREIAAMEGRVFDEIYSKLPKEQPTENIKVEIQNTESCSRYIGVILEDIVVGSSPKWMQARLVASGMEPINNVVDITNYVMLEIGSPLHAFDFDNIVNEDGSVNIMIRNAKESEKLVLLDGKEMELHKDDLLIANEKKILALAGIKGGLDSGIYPSTTKIVLEAANFKGFNIRKTRQRHGLSTEAQIRFEKSISPQLAEFAATRAIELLKEIAGAKVVAFSDANFAQEQEKRERLHFDYAKGLLGAEVENKKMHEIISNLGFKIENKTDEGFEAVIPFWRLDIEGQADLVEEIGRIVGYGNIENSPILEDIAFANTNKLRKFEWKLISKMNGLGFDEVRLYSFYSEKEAHDCNIIKKHFEIENPLSEELSLMRISLIPNLLKSMGENAKHLADFSIFELGREYHQGEEGQQEKKKIAGACFDASKKDIELFYFLKGKLQSLFGNISDEKIEFLVPSEWENGIFHKTRTAEIFAGGEKIGIVGQVNKVVAKKFGTKKPVIVFEFDVEKLFAKAIKEKTFEKIGKFPAVLRDLSMFVDFKKESAEVVKTIEQVAGDSLQEIELFDVYEDRENNRKSLAFHLSFCKKDATLESEEIDFLVNKIIASLESSGVEVRTR
jgi:phenylalanyl-tRNA synthetase beta chain